MLHRINSKIKTLLVLSMIFLSQFESNNIYAQIKFPKLPKDIPGKIKIISDWINSVAAFERALQNIAKMNASDFGKNVSVTKIAPGKQNAVQNISANEITKPIIKNGQFTNLYFEPVAYFNNQLFPSAIISLASFRGDSPDTLFEAIRRPLGFRIHSKKTNIPLRWEIECVDKSYFDKVGGTFLYTNNSIKTVTLFNADSIPWNYKTLVNTVSPIPINLYFRLFDEKGNKVEKLVTVTVRSIYDCVTSYNQEDLRQLFSAYVQEDDNPKIDGILREALNSKMVNQFVGYQFNKTYGNSYIDLQVAAIWKVLHDRGFQYTSIADNSAINNDTAYSQAVRTFDVAMKTYQANCVDGTVVFASILRRIGIRSVLVAVPGHCFLGYYLNEDNNDAIHYLETTMLSNTTYLSKDSVLSFQKIIAQCFPKVSMKNSSLMTKEYLLQFLDARIAGEGNWTKYSGEFPADKYPNAIQKIDLNEQRKLIQPLPF